MGRHQWSIIGPLGVEEEQGGWVTRNYCIAGFVGYVVSAVAGVCSNSEGWTQYEARLGAPFVGAC